MKIVFVGYMASGKSAVAKAVSKELNLDLVDLDTYIETKEQLSIPQIFEKHGEIYFRKKETFYLKELLQRTDSFILSVGGGTPCFGDNMNSILENAVSLYLRATVQTIFNRVIHEKAQRPLVASIADENLQEFIAKHLFERTPFYDRANHIVSVNDKNIAEISKEIIELING